MTGGPRLLVAETAGRRTVSGGGELAGWAGFLVRAESAPPALFFIF
jgi:hypothetical protein